MSMEGGAAAGRLSRMSSPAPLPWRAALLAAAGAFLVSRLLVFLLASVPALLQPAATRGPPSDRVVLAFDAGRVGAHLHALSRANDAGWYRGIALAGYEARPFSAERQANWAFFPLLPLAWAAAIAAFGDGLCGALLLPNAMFFLGLVALHLVCRETGRDAAQAGRATWVAALAPSAYFFSFPGTEALFFCLGATCLLAALRGCWWLVALAGIAATATRFPGNVLVPAVLLLCWQRGQLHARPVAACLLMPLGTALFACWLWRLTGNAFAFADIQAAWGRSLEPPVRAMGIVVLRPQEIAIDWNFRYLNLAAVMLAALALRHFLRRREYAFAALLALGIGLPLMTGTLTSMSRYAGALFPLAIAVGDAIATPLRERLWWIASVAGLAAMTLAFGFGLSFAAA